MNCQELATAAIEKLNIKILLLNNQHLGMVVQWEDRFYKVGCVKNGGRRATSVWHVAALQVLFMWVLYGCAVGRQMQQAYWLHL